MSTELPQAETDLYATEMMLPTAKILPSDEML
jgi:hypothetical protein